MSDLRQKTFHAMKWSFIGTIGMNAIHFIITVILARMLTPAEFGLIAMLSIFLAVATSFLDSGFGAALIQKQVTTRADESSVFYFNLMISLALFGAIWLAAPAIARFFNEPLLVPLARFLGFNVVIGAFGVVQGALMMKRLDFKTQSKVTVTATLVSGILGVTLAFQGFGVWALAAQAVAMNLVRVILFWELNAWRPAATFSMVSLKSMFPYGSRLLGSSLLNTIYENAYQVLIGRLYSKADLGFYTRALSTQRLPVSVITSILSQVAFPAFSSIQDDRPRLKSAYRKTITFSAFLTFPVMLGLIAVARPMFLLVFGPKWEPSIVYFQVLCIAGMLLPLHALNLSVLMAVGRSDIFLRLEVIKKILITVAIVATVPFGILAMVWGQVVTSFLCLGVNTHYSGVLIDYPLGQQLRDVSPCFLLSCAMAALVYAFSFGVNEDLWFKFPIQIVLGALLYFAGSAAFKLSPMLELKRIANARHFKTTAVH